MHQPDKKNVPVWGARVNMEWWRNAEDWPAWAKPMQKDKWKEHGLVLWDHRMQQITGLSATQALELHNHLRTTEDWREDGLDIGEPATGISLTDREREPEAVLVNEMSLSPDQLQEILEMLERKEPELQRLREAEDKELRRRLGKVYWFILNFAGPRETRVQPSAIDSSE